MPIAYAAVARSECILVEFTSQQTAAAQVHNVVIPFLLKDLADQKGRKSYQFPKSPDWLLHIFVQDEIAYMCVTDKRFSMQTAYQFLSAVEKKFINVYGRRAKTAIAFAYNSDFGPIFEELTNEYSSLTEAKLKKLNAQIDDVKSIMLVNIDNVIRNAHSLELVNEKAAYLEDNAHRFNRSATRVKRTFWWLNTKYMLIMVGIVMLLVFIIVGSVCGFTFKKCR